MLHQTFKLGCSKNAGRFLVQVWRDSQRRTVCAVHTKKSIIHPLLCLKEGHSLSLMPAVPAPCPLSLSPATCTYTMQKWTERFVYIVYGELQSKCMPGRGVVPSYEQTTLCIGLPPIAFVISSHPVSDLGLTWQSISVGHLPPGLTKCNWPGGMVMHHTPVSSRTGLVMSSWNTVLCIIILVHSIVEKTQVHMS